MEASTTPFLTYGLSVTVNLCLLHAERRSTFCFLG